MSAEAIAADFEAILASFRALGGTADNVTRREGPLGLGLFPINPDEPVTLHVPERLLIDTKLVVLDGEDLVVDPACDVDGDVRAFFNEYQQRFSWGAEGRARTEAFERGLRTLPESLLKRLKELRLIDQIHIDEADWLSEMRRAFINSRRIAYRGHPVIMPIIELLNHSADGGSYDTKDGIRVAGVFAGEVLVNYNRACDSIGRFFNYGFTGPEQCAFSLPMRVPLPEGKSLIVGIGYDQTVVQDGFALPKCEVEGGEWRLAHLKIGQKNAPRVPRTVVRRVLKTFPQPLADEIFDRVRSGNLLALADLLEAADGAPGEVAAGLRAAIRWQLKAMSQSFGAREAAQSKFVSESIL